MSKRSQLLLREPRWRTANTLARTCIPFPVASWIYENGSLTARLRRLYGDNFKLRVVNQSWLHPYQDEASLLGMPSYRHALIREVLLCNGGLPMVMARSVMPFDVLQGGGKRLTRLGTRPLGEILFSYRGLRRDCLDYARIDAIDWRQEAARFAGREAAWGRRSLYRVAGGHMLVCEFFLSKLLFSL
ncbi:chorismate lyase [Candidatus Methylospira mobilis]|uniref:chorismate--pyruvate lyase family protein n=1 Tax=Candidatus Methylospira mobilis TaxID=1808979 RepID=UPI001884930B|nr:chorismate lyase [Candidatus Methylospira mobilis]WNV03658.1 chorismate lyase [Candidatus Methylospira mobilis]